MVIDRESWAIISPLLDRLLERPASERAAALAGIDLSPDQRTALISLLEAHDADDDPLSDSAAHLLGLSQALTESLDRTGRGDTTTP